LLDKEFPIQTGYLKRKQSIENAKILWEKTQTKHQAISVEQKPPFRGEHHKKKRVCTGSWRGLSDRSGESHFHSKRLREPCRPNLKGGVRALRRYPRNCAGRKRLFSRRRFPIGKKNGIEGQSLREKGQEQCVEEAHEANIEGKGGATAKWKR